MNIFKKSLHIWITLTSFAGFLAGWASLAQAARQTVQVSANSAGLQLIANLPAIQNVDNLLHTSPARSNSMLGYKINPATPTPLPQPTIQPTIQPQAPVIIYTPPLKTSGS